MNKTPYILIAWAFWLIWAFGYQAVWQRAKVELNGTVISSVDRPAKNAPRYFSEYVVKSDAGLDQTYIAGPTDASLQRSLPVGTRVVKNRGELSYEINGSLVEFPKYFYGGVLAFAMITILAAMMMIFRRPLDT
jgi:hypothetical protein